MFDPAFFDAAFFDVVEIQPAPGPTPEPAPAPSPEPSVVRRSRIIRHQAGPLKITRIRSRE